MNRRKEEEEKEGRKFWYSNITIIFKTVFDLIFFIHFTLFYEYHSS